jgi:hypothetical protein
VAALWVGIYVDISQKYKMGAISTGMANALEPAKKYTKNNKITKINSFWPISPKYRVER